MPQVQLCIKPCAFNLWRAASLPVGVVCQVELLPGPAIHVVLPHLKLEAEGAMLLNKSCGASWQLAMLQAASRATLDRSRRTSSKTGWQARSNKPHRPCWSTLAPR
jgi:hypothetical protein